MRYGGHLGQITSDEPLADGKAISVRVRRDFTITNADRLLTIARGLYCDLNPGARVDDAIAMVPYGADALLVILEQAA